MNVGGKGRNLCLFRSCVNSSANSADVDKKERHVEERDESYHKNSKKAQNNQIFR